MNTREFRFGIVFGMAPDAKTFLSTSQEIERLGYSSMLMADTLWTPSPFPALSAAAAVTDTLRFGTHVLAAPFRTPATVARDTDALDFLSGGRFELGLGTGRPDAAHEAEQLGMPFGTPGERLAQVGATIEAVKAQFAAKNRPRPHIMLAGTGRRLFELAVTEADGLTLAVRQEATEEVLASKVGELQAIAGSRFDDLELAMNIGVVGDEIPGWLKRMAGDLPQDSYTWLRGTPQQMAETLKRRRDRLGISYVTISQPYAETFRPVMDLLS